MRKTIAFDVYGTLINTHGVVVQLEELMGKTSIMFSQVWRQKQLEYSFRRGLMRKYVDFSTCTEQALDFTCIQLNVGLSSDQKSTLLKAYQTLPVFSDVKESLALLANNHQLVAFSNGTTSAVDKLLNHAEIKGYFSDIVSADEIKTFKPNPDIYQHLLKRTQSIAENTWLVSSNPFDVIGAISVDMRAAWIQRSNNDVFDPWGIEPTTICKDLAILNEKIY